MMVSHLRHIDISDFSIALPVVLTVAMMPLSYSIANGIGVGFISWVVLRSAVGKAREVSPLLWIVAVGFLVYFARDGIQTLVGASNSDRRFSVRMVTGRMAAHERCHHHPVDRRPSRCPARSKSSPPTAPVEAWE